MLITMFSFLLSTALPAAAITSLIWTVATKERAKQASATARDRR